MRRQLTVPRLLSVLWACGLSSIALIAGCGSSDSTPAQKFEKPAGYKESDTKHTPEDAIKSLRGDKSDEPIKSGKSKARR
ncbi:MAG: hypothetical protein U0790_03320 [Isosphaeraceae bacterium]